MSFLASNTTYGPPSPSATEASVAATEASAHQAFSLILVGSLSVLIWDILDSCLEDWALVFQRRINIQTIVFALSRFSTFGYLLASVITPLVTSSNADACKSGTAATQVFFNLALVSINILFYFRVCAVYHGNRWVAWWFMIALLGLVGAGVYTFFTATSPSNPNLEGECHLVVNKSYLVVVPVLQGAFDFIISLAITYKLGGQIQVDGVKTHLIHLIRNGKLADIHRFRLRFMHDSQLYFLLTACIKIPVFISYGVFRPSTESSALQLAISFPDLVVSSIMAAKIYRRLRLGRPGLITTNPTSVATLPSGDVTTHYRSSINPQTASTKNSANRLSQIEHKYPPLPRPPPEYNPGTKL